MNARDIELSNTAWDEMIFTSVSSNPKNLQTRYSFGSKATNAQGQVTFSQIKAGDYTGEIEGGPYVGDYVKVISLTSDQDILANLTPYYDLEVTVTNSSGSAIADASVKLTESDGTVVTLTTDVTGIATFPHCGAGNFSIEVTKENYQTLSTTGTIEGASEVILLTLALDILPKLVLVTTAQTNYALDTSYKYVSMLVVGKGGRRDNSIKDEAGGSGMVVYKKNIDISTIAGTTKLIDVRFNTILPSPTSTTPSTLVRWQEGDWSDNNTKIVGAGNAPDNSSDGATNAYFFKGSNDIKEQLDGYGSSGGGFSYYAGGGSSSNNSLNFPGEGGDGPFGFGGRTGVTKGAVIPLTSIFNGNGRGGDSVRTGTTPYAGGGGGYSEGNGSGTNYGGGVSYRQAGTTLAGLVCLYYHSTAL